MRYCGRCRIGTFDEHDLCVLCGAPAEPATGWRRVAEGLGGTLQTLLNPAIWGVVVTLAVLLVFAAVTRAEVRTPLGALPFASPGSTPTLALLRSDPAGVAWRLLLPALLQSLILALAFLTLLSLLRRRRRPSDEPNKDHRFAA